MRLFLAALLATSIAAALNAQPQQRFGEKVEVKLIEIDVVVTDADGHRIHGLKKDDFQLFESRKPQPITNFTEYGEPPAPSRPAEAEPPASVQPPQAVVRPPQTFVIVLDALPRFQDARAKAFAQLDGLITRLMREGDRASVFFWSPGTQSLNTMIDGSSDLEAVRAALRRAETTFTSVAFDPVGDAATRQAFTDAAVAPGAAASGESQRSVVNPAVEGSTNNFLGGEEDLVMFRRKTAALQLLMTSLGAATGKKTALYVANDFGWPTTDSSRVRARSMVEDVAKAANAGGVTFYAVHPALPFAEFEKGSLDASVRDTIYPLSEIQPASPHAFHTGLEALNSIAEPTGGAIGFGPQSVETVGRTVVDDVSSYYSIAYRARSDGRDRERHIVVKTKNPAYRVRSRSSFVEKSNETLARDTLMTRLFAESGGDDIQFEVEQGEPRRSGRGQWLLPVVLWIRAGQFEFVPQGGERVANLSILIVSGNGLSEVTPVKEDTLRVVESKHLTNGFVKYSVEILCNARGSKVSIGVYDRATHLLGVRTIDNRGRFE